MSRYRETDLAYGDIPQRWDRERFERIGSRGSGPRFEEDFRYEERDRPGHRDVLVADHIERRGSRGRFEESDRFFEEQEARARAASRRRRRTDKELFGDIDPREVADLALTPYAPPRPGIIRRQSSLDTFDRRSSRREREDYRIPAYTPVPLPVRRRHHHHEHHHHDHWDEPEDYREVEIQRERSVHRRRGPKPPKEESKAPSSSSSSSSSSTEYIEPPPKSRATSRAPSSKPPREVIHETVVEKVAPPPSAPSVKSSSFEASVREERRFKKGKTRMPKRLVRLEAIMDLGYPFDEEDDFFVLRIALEKEQIDEVIHISETYKDGEKKKVYRFEKTVEEEEVPAPAPVGDREEIERTEWINPPTVIGARSRAKSIREASPSAKSSISRRGSPRTRRPSSPGTYVERQTVYEEHRSPPPPPPPPAPEYYEREERIVEERTPSHHHHHHHDHHGGALVVQDREYRSDRDINAEIRALETERRALRFEREAEQKRDLAVRIRERRSADDLQLVEYRRPAREEMVVYEREKSPPRNVIRVEKDRKGRMALVRSAH